MNQALALGILDSGHSVLLTGAAGSGKTYTLNCFIQHARSKGKVVAVTASTGIAATHLGGVTIHSWAGIGIASEYQPQLVRSMSKSRRTQIESADVLVIDEISMFHDFRLDIIERICREVRGGGEPFGGLQIVICGDFFQLPPINREEGRSGGFVTNSKSWEELQPIVCYLEEQHRQHDNVLADILTAMRRNDLRRKHVEALLDRQSNEPPREDVTLLYTHNQDVENINNSKLAVLNGEEEVYEMILTGRSKAKETLLKSCLAPELLRLKVGALVMFVKNSQEKKYVNGTTGHVVRFDKDTHYPIVRTKAGTEILVKPETWELKDGEKKLASAVQIPLRLAWAITVHKSQGMTLDQAHVDLRGAFVPGMGYVALSRVKTLETLTIGGLNKTSLQLHPEAYAIDSQLQRLSYQNENTFSSLLDRGQEIINGIASNKQKKSKEQSTKGPWVEKLAKIREKYPNAYRPWKPMDDLKLLKKFEEDVSIDEVSQLLGRHPNSVKLRLHKHLGERLVGHIEFRDFDFERAEKQKSK